MRWTTTVVSSERPNFALFMWLLVFWICLCSLKLCQCKETDCDYTESYDKVVTVNVTEPVHITKYKWCLDIPPRCPDNKQEYRTVKRNVTIPKMRTVRRCCKDQIQLYDECVPKCTEDRCPNVQCAPGTDKCKCKPGYIGYLCRQKCDVGRWGTGCKTACDKACSDCDHRTGCCKTVAADVADRSALNLCAAAAAAAVPIAARQISDAGRDDGRTGDDDESSSAGRFESAQSSQTLVVPTWEPTAAEAENVENASAVAVESQTQRRNDVNGGGQFVRTVTKMEVTVYKYDEVVKKLVWISAMTVMAIAMVFVIMFVVFFNCYGASKVQMMAAAAAMAGRRSSMTSMTAAAAACGKTRETCIGTQNLGHVPPDRYTKSPALRTPSTNVDLPIHPEIFCPIFSAPHYPGSTLYDSPQPLYEILC